MKQNKSHPFSERHPKLLGFFVNDIKKRNEKHKIKLKSYIIFF